MKTLLAQICAARLASLDWHYQAEGPSFYAQHVLAEKCAEAFDGLDDELTETYWLGELQKTPPTQGDIHAEALEHYKRTAEAKQTPAERVREAFLLVAAHCEELKRSERMCLGVQSILDSISQKAYQFTGLVSRTLCNSKQ